MFICTKSYPVRTMLDKRLEICGIMCYNVSEEIFVPRAAAMPPGLLRQKEQENVMVSEKLVIVNDEGLHMRPAGALVKAASSFKNCNITIIYNGKRTDAKSVMSVMLAGVNCGAQIVLECDGENEQQALDTLSEMIRSAFK